MEERARTQDGHPVTPPFGPWYKEIESPQTPHSLHSQPSSLEDTPITPPDQYSALSRGPPRIDLNLAQVQSKSLQLQGNIQDSSTDLLLEPIRLFQSSDPFSDLQLGELVGLGQWSKVYKAWESPKTGPKDSTRVYAAKLANSKFAVKTIKHEARILTYLSSDPMAEQHTVKFYGFDMQHHALITEYMEVPNGMRIHEMLTLGICTPAGLARDLAHGLDFLHSKGLIHGDIKPSNIYIRSIRDSNYLQETSGGTGQQRPDAHQFRAVYGDFSASRLETPKTMPGESAGTYDYMAPELFSATLQDSYCTKASDVYALGVALMTVVAGQSPYDLAPHLIARRTMAKQGTPLSFMQNNIEAWRKLESSEIMALVEMAVASTPGTRCDASTLKDQADRMTTNA